MFEPEKDKIQELHNILVPRIVSEVQITWSSFVEFKVLPKDIKALIIWCSENLDGLTGYTIDPIKENANSDNHEHDFTMQYWVSQWIEKAMERASFKVGDIITEENSNAFIDELKKGFR